MSDANLSVIEAERARQIQRLETLGSIVSGCPACQVFYKAERPVDVFAPRHKASDRCLSGGRPHCTCPTCWG